jgi:hypothetical protein
MDDRLNTCAANYFEGDPAVKYQ